MSSCIFLVCHVQSSLGKGDRWVEICSAVTGTRPPAPAADLGGTLHLRPDAEPANLFQCVEFKTLLPELPASSPDKQGPAAFPTVPGNRQSEKQRSWQGGVCHFGGVTLPLPGGYSACPGGVEGEKVFVADLFLAAA